MYSNLFLSNRFNGYFSIFLFISFKYNISIYNLDVNNAKLFNIPKTSKHQGGSCFGFSVALYTNDEDSVLLVGAPTANSSAIQRVIEPGAVFQCSINNACKEWIIDDTESDWCGGEHVINQNKNNAWIGATIAVENRTDPKVVVC